MEEVLPAWRTSLPRLEVRIARAESKFVERSCDNQADFCPFGGPDAPYAPRSYHEARKVGRELHQPWLVGNPEAIRTTYPFRSGYPTSRIGSILNGSTKQFGWLRPSATKICSLSIASATPQPSQFAILVVKLYLDFGSCSPMHLADYFRFARRPGMVAIDCHKPTSRCRSAGHNQDSFRISRPSTQNVVFRFPQHSLPPWIMQTSIFSLTTIAPHTILL
jgi:hypothetical protein